MNTDYPALMPEKKEKIQSEAGIRLLFLSIDKMYKNNNENLCKITINKAFSFMV